MTDNDEPRSEPGAGTPEGYTKEQPSDEELGEPGTPGAGLTAEAPHAADAEAVEHGEKPLHDARDSSAAIVAHHDTASHMDAHTTLSDDDHGHVEERVGPIDWRAWTFAAVGAAAGLLVVATFWLAVYR